MLRIILDQRIGGGKNMSGRAVILFEAEKLRLREVALEIQNIFYIGAAESIDGLRIVANDGKIL